MMGMDEDEESDEGGIEVEEQKPELKEPTKYAVILHNDDYSTMEFVIDVLKRYFQKTEEQAVEVMLKVHNIGQGVAGIYSQEIAETKVAQVSDYASSNGFPLRCTSEPL